MSAIEILQRHNIRPSLQRVAVMEYLLENRTHPTVEEIFESLSPKMHTLSKTTIYNTLKVLTDNGAILSLNLNDGTTHYDGYTDAHAHFQCTKCLKIYDVEMPFMASELTEAASFGHKIEDVKVYYKGVCEKCNKQQEI